MAKKHKFETLYKTSGGLSLTRSELISFYSAKAKINKRIKEYNNKLSGEKYIYDDGTVTTIADLRKAGVPVDFLMTEKKYGIGKIKTKRELNIFISEVQSESGFDDIINAKMQNHIDKYENTLRKVFGAKTADEIMNELNKLPKSTQHKLFTTYEIFDVHKPYEYEDKKESYTEMVKEKIKEAQK